MTLGSAMINAVTGLGARARATALVANNLANQRTLGYSRRELIQSSSALGGVRVDGVERVVNTALLIEKRNAEAADANISTRANFHQRIERVVGNPGISGGNGALKSALTAFQASLINATEGPNTESELIQIAAAAKTLTNRFNEASKAVQAERSKADKEIAKDIGKINSALERIVRLNRSVAVATNSGDDPSTHMDHRQLAIDELNSIIPVQVVPRSNNRVAIFTAKGMPLLDGITPAKLEYNEVGQLSPEMNVGDGSLLRLTVDGEELDEWQMEYYSGGSLGANFHIRDVLAPEVQEELDVLALELHLRFSSADVDRTASGNGANGPSNARGLFIYDGPAAIKSNDKNGNASTVDYGHADYNGHENYAGISARISVNPLVDPDGSAQEYYRFRGGIHEANEAPKGATDQLNRFKGALSDYNSSVNDEVFSHDETYIDRISDFESRIGTRRVVTQSALTDNNSQLQTITESFLANGVDQDAETHKLLLLQNAFSANARVVQAVDNMLAEILRW